MNRINIGIIGLGTIGAGVVKLIHKNSQVILQKSGIKLNIKKAADIDKRKKEELKLSSTVFTTNANDVISDPEIDIIVELIGGTTKANEFIINGIKAGKHIVTANKALLSQKGNKIFNTAYKYNKFIGFEASVAGGVPILKSIRESLLPNRITKIYGILNGTTNFILTKMEKDNLEFKDALLLAQKLGFAEANPEYDIKGTDSAHKLQILASFAFNTDVKFKDIYFEGIDKITLDDLKYIHSLGYKVKLLSIAKLDLRHKIYECRVHPTMIHTSNPLSTVSQEYNAILIDGDAVGEQIYYGKGAGAFPTASAVVSDIIDIAKKILNNNEKIFDRSFQISDDLTMKKFGDISSRYYLRFKTCDKPGVLAKISGILGKNNISLSSVLQKETGQNIVPIVMLTHISKESDIQRAIKIIDKLDIIKSKTNIIRIEDNM